jgi:hypothetical protein
MHSLASRKKLILTVLCALVGANASVAQTAQIKVGPNVQVSKAREKLAQGEVFFGADPVDANHLIACTTVYLPANEHLFGMDTYVSFDGGKSWDLTLKDFYGGDPACAIGVDGIAYFIGGGKNGLTLQRSTDGGKNWQDPLVLPKVENPDREYVIADTTNGKRRGYVYVDSWGHDTTTQAGEAVTAINLWTSHDQGASFGPPTKRVSLSPRMLWPMSAPAVMSDGTVIGSFGEFKKEYTDAECTGHPNADLKFTSSDDGGQSLSQPVVISDLCMDMNQEKANSASFIATDRTDGPFKDRIYVVWGDRRSGHDKILFSSSSDKGKTWSHPIALSDDRGDVDRDNFMPRIAVNRDGVVGVVWNDRHDSPDNYSYEQRFTASIDGGDTWLPSVRASSAPTDWKKNEDFALLPYASPGNYSITVHKFNFTGGDTEGMEADAAGVFHPLWVDNRTGILQVWTTTVTVDGKAIKNGDASLADLDDLDKNAQLDLTNVHFDRATGLLTMDARVKNLDKKVELSGPVKVRLTWVGSGLGNVHVANADNKITGPGAVWDFTPQFNGKSLKADEKSESRQFVFKITEQKQLEQLKYNLESGGFGPGMPPGLLQFQAKLLGKLPKQ